MSPEMPKVGTIGWMDLTVGNAEKVRDFYGAVVGWTHDRFDMGGYADYVMKSPAGEPVAGVCHAKGVNANIPPHWILYAVVADLAEAIARVTLLGGEVIDGPRSAGGGRMCIIKDPAGALFGLWQG